MEEYINKLNSKNGIKIPILSESKILSITNFFTALATLIPALYFFKNNVKKDFKTLKEVNEYINKKERTSAMSKFIKGIVLIFVAIRLWFFFVPNKTQISLGILIKYLFHSNIITNEFYAILKKIKPDNMSKFGD
jgi:cytochrome b subunit of formate dehydrogenase